MAVRAPFARVAQFDKDAIDRDAEKLERNIQRKFFSDDQAPARDLFELTDVQTKNFRVFYGQLARVDTTARSIVVLLPRPDDPLADVIRVASVAGAGAITLLPIASDTFVNSTTSFAMTAAKQSVELYPDRIAKNWIVASDGQAVPADVVITPASISTTQNSWAPVDATDVTKTWSLARVVRVTLGASVNINGADPNVLVTRKTIEVVSAGGNVAPFYLRLVRQSTAGISGGKFLVPYPNDAFVILSLPVEIVLDTASGGWRVE